MVKLVEIYHTEAGAIDFDAWLTHFSKTRKPDEIKLLKHAYSLSTLAGEEHPTFTGTSCLQQGIEIADILINLNLDIDTIASALIYPSYHYADLSKEDINEQLSPTIAKLIVGVSQMDSIRILHQQSSHLEHNPNQVDNLRKMLLAMVDDVRVVLIKLAERTCIMREAKVLNQQKRIDLAKEIQDIYAPLANRLGIGQIKWELEDLAFRYSQPETYKDIAKSLDLKRQERETYIKNVISQLENEIKKESIRDFEVNGRAKHIYSIYRKMKRKNVDYSQIYDASAVRVLVQTIEDCYTVLGVVHSLWQPITEEFDDYVSNPKPNGYRSLHTAVIGPGNHNVEVQIRTYEMHQESELGVAAHWIYKEGTGQGGSYDQKIVMLRQVIEWQKELAHTENQLEQPQTAIFEDRVYVFTPNGQIIDLPTGATPLDFAYTIHTEIGHRCRGAKINGSIVPLTYQLKTGDRVEILTAKHPQPSRDWVNQNLGYLKTSRAKAKVHHWFKKQDYEQNLADGRDMLEKELRRLHLDNINFEAIAKRFNKKSPDDMYAALGGNDLRLGQLIHYIEELQKTSESTKTSDETFTPPIKPVTTRPTGKGISIQGVGNLLTTIANCCHPVPGDAIIGFITRGRGVSIHRQDCVNILSANEEQKQRFIDVTWGEDSGTYPVDIFVNAYDRHGLVRDITTLLSNEKINILALNTVTNKSEHSAHVRLTLEVPDLNILSRLFDKINQLPNIITVERQKTGG